MLRGSPKYIKRNNFVQHTLYEVIRHLQSANKLFEPLVKDLQYKLYVITSYSIHYTKLYDTDEQARYIEAELENGHIVASLYVPNGNPSDGEVIGSDKFNYKLAWFDRLKQHTKELLDTGKPVILGGDYNIIPNDEDVYSAKAFVDNALINLPARKKFRELLNLGLTEIYGSTLV